VPHYNRSRGHGRIIGMKKLVLVVAQETAFRARIARLLQPAGYAVELAANEKRTLELIVNQAIDVAIIVTGADVAGIALARQISDRVANLIMLAERSDDLARLRHSLPGADIYPSQPLDEQALLNRLVEVMASPESDETAPTPDALCAQGCRIDPAGRTFIHADGREAALTRAEFSLLMALARNPGRVLSRDELNHAIAGHGSEPYGRSVDMQIGRLRRKIEPNQKTPTFILTVSGAGYKFAAGPTVDRHRESPASIATNHQAKDGPIGLDGIRLTGPAPERAQGRRLELSYSGSERRQLTMLSCELVGPTTTAEDIDPEDFARVVHSFHEACATVIANMGGSIASSTGHDVLALFGYPTAHEDDAERAVHAGLDLTAKIGELVWTSGEPLKTRTGIATGLVVVRNQRAIGEPSTLAAQLRSVAPANSILVATSTRRLLSHAFVCNDPGSYKLADGSQTVTACIVAGRQPVESRFSSMRGPRLTQFVGRQHELQRLLDLWGRAKAGAGQVALLCGEAGIGKSRVCEVLLQHIATEPHVIIRYQCALHHANSPFYPVIDQLERASQFAQGDAPAVKLEKLRAALSEAGTMPLADIRSCAVLLSIPTDEISAQSSTPQRQKDLTIAVVIRQILGLARAAPVVIELADAHWADFSTLELVSRIVTSIRSAPVFVLMSFRPEFFPQWLDEPHVTMLRLDRLGREQTEAIIFDVAGQKALPYEVSAQIISKTDGVPLFVEELTKSVLESGLLKDKGGRHVADRLVPQLAIPTTLLGSLTARLDRLGPAKEIAQIGAAIGREFSYRLIAAVAPVSNLSLNAALAQLAAPELIFARGNPPDSSYVFKHALVQDAAYGTLVRSERQQLHGRIADALDKGFPETVETQPELLAHHLIEAGLTERALHYVRKAGERAIECSANAEAIGHLTQALELLQSRPDSPARTRRALEFEVLLSQAMIAAYGYAARETAEVLRRAKTHIDDLTDPEQKLAILYGIWACDYVGGEVARQTSSAAEFLTEAERHNDVASLCVAHRITGTTYLTKGEFAAALPHLEQARALYDPQQHVPLQYRYGQDVGAAASCYLSWAMWHLGFVDRASQVAVEAAERAEELSHPHTQAFTICHARGMIDIFQRSSQDMRSYACATVSLCREHGLSHWMACARILEGWATVSEGEVDRGMELLRAGVAAWRKAGARLWLPLFQTLEAEAYAKQGRYKAALGAIEQAIAISEETGERWYLAEILRIKAELLLASGRAGDRVEIFLTRSLEIARSQQARCWELRTACDLASLWQSGGRENEALQLLKPVYAQFTEGFDSVDLRHAKRILDSLEPALSERKAKPRKRISDPDRSR
jgi:predicted ATPase/DNA-binding response OmpR family regulator/class 3 adenylate cyclase